MSHFSNALYASTSPITAQHYKQQQRQYKRMCVYALSNNAAGHICLLVCSGIKVAARRTWRQNTYMPTLICLNI